MNRVTDAFPGVSAISESREKLSQTNDCLEAPFCVVPNRLTFTFCSLFRGKGLVNDVWVFM